jgi:hypothetical protein
MLTVLVFDYMYQSVRICLIPACRQEGGRAGLWQKGDFQTKRVDFEQPVIYLKQ